MTQLLLDEHVIIIQPALVRQLGSMVDAAILQQLHYWLWRSQNQHAGHKWVYKTVDEWSDEIGVTSKQARSAIQRLEAHGLVISAQPEGSNRRKWYRINYDHAILTEAESGDSNRPTGPMEAPHRADGSAPQGRSLVTENTTKNTPENTRDQRSQELAELLADLIEQNGSKRPRVTDAWLLSIDRMIRLDGRDPADIERAIRWAQADTFWSANILSPDKLRKHYDRMRLQASRNKSRPLTGVADYLSTLQG